MEPAAVARQNVTWWIHELPVWCIRFVEILAMNQYHKYNIMKQLIHKAQYNKLITSPSIAKTLLLI